MGQHSKYSFEMKLAAVTKYLEGSCSTESSARSLERMERGLLNGQQYISLWGLKD